MQSTTDYKLFKFLDMNRLGGVDEKHVDKLAERIKEKNLLPYNPILVTEDMEILQGQHRLKAAEKLGVPIYYQIAEGVAVKDMLTLNTSKPWRKQDILNFYCKLHYPEYLKLNKFIKDHSIPTGLAITLAIGLTEESNEAFHRGEFTFYDGLLSMDIVEVSENIEFIKGLIPGKNKTWLFAAKVWKAMITLVRHPLYEKERFKQNCITLSSRIWAKPSFEEYLNLFQYIYNYSKQNKISIKDGVARENA